MDDTQMAIVDRETYDAGRLLTVDEIADLLRVPRSWVYSRTRQTGPGSIPHLKAGKYCRFERRAVLTWLRDRGGK